MFDCDGTLLDGDVSTLTGWFLMKNGLVDQARIPSEFQSESFYLNMTLADFERVKIAVEKVFGLIHLLEWEILIQAGLPESSVEQYSSQAIELAFKNKWVSLSSTLPQILNIFSKRAWIVSGSTRPTVLTVAKKLGVVPTRVIATELEVLDGIYQARFSDEGFVWQGGKVRALQAAKVLPVFVAGDSIGDLHMLEMATGWAWCVIWGEDRLGAMEFKQVLESRLPPGVKIPAQPGIYVDRGPKNWVFEVK